MLLQSIVENERDLGGMSSLNKKSEKRPKQARANAQTEVMPAKAPLANRFGVSSSFEPCLVKNYSRISARVEGRTKTTKTFLSCS